MGLIYQTHLSFIRLGIDLLSKVGLMNQAPVFFLNQFSVVPNFVLITAPQPIMLKKKENRAPIMGIKVMMLTSIKPRITARIVEGFLLPKALERLSPKK